MNSESKYSSECDQVMRGVCLNERQPSTELRKCLGVETIGDAMKRCKPRWLGNVERKGDVNACTRLVVEGKKKTDRGRPGRTLFLAALSAES